MGQGAVMANDECLMEITELSAAEYGETFTAQYIYNKVAFAELNRDKASSIAYLAIGDTKPRFGIILGDRDGILRSPFSAPFGGFTQCGKQRLDYMDEAARLVVDYARGRNRQLLITPPSMVYDIGEGSKWVNILSRHMRQRFVDLNYHFSPSRVADYESRIERSARKNLRHAEREDFTFVKLNSQCRDDVARAYEVIRRNREERGFPLRMTLEQVWQTVSRVVEADFFVLQHGGVDMAAAQVFHVSEGAAQVVYWGDIREYSALRPMNMLTYSLFRYYWEQGLRLLDIGPSTEDGIPNFGLCEFKESIGCEVTPKYSFLI